MGWCCRARRELHFTNEWELWKERFLQNCVGKLREASVVATGKNLQQSVKEWIRGSSQSCMLHFSGCLWSGVLPVLLQLLLGKHLLSFFQGQKIEIAVQFWPKNLFQIHPPLILFTIF